MSAPRPRAAVVFLHGRGLGLETAAEVAHAFPEVDLLAPTGGVALRRGHTWFENERIGIARPDSVAAAEQHLLAWCEDGPLRGRPAWLCGFSNGGALAAHLLIRHPARFLGAALLSAPLVLPPWPDHALAGKPILYAHGDERDEVVTPDFYEAAEAYLLGPSASAVTDRRLPAGHAIDPAMVVELGQWFEAVRGKRDAGIGYQ